MVPNGLDRLLTEKMSQTLTHFAWTGYPNHSGIPTWPINAFRNVPRWILQSLMDGSS